jgi:putative glycosyltransferase (TIGR04372 family)
LHIRTSIFHSDDADYRNATFANYIASIRYITSLGGKVVRLGDAGSGIVSCHVPGLVDYPNTRLKSEAMDLFLIARCRFYLGTLSGILDTAYLLRTPTLCVNSLHFDMRSPNPKDRMLYKRIRRKGEKRLLTFGEALDCYQDILATNWRLRYEFIENSSDEILAAVMEFISVMNGNQRITPRQVAVRRRLIRERIRYAESHGGLRSMLTASIVFSQCQVIDFSLEGFRGGDIPPCF